MWIPKSFGPAAFSIVLCLSASPARIPAADFTDWQEHMQPITPRSYVCRRASTPIQVDGKLDEAAWMTAPWTEAFVDIQGSSKPQPRLRTRAKLLWDDDYLYLAAELEEPHVWATLTNHDSVIFRDPDFEVFIDPKGETEPYYEFEMNALNTTWDLLLDKPYQDGGKPHNEWEISGAKTAVSVQGTLNEPGDKDQGWTLELAFPWKALSEHARHAGAPLDGEQWRIDFSRVEWQITTTNGVYRKVPNQPEDNWVWSPTGVIDMHRPEMWGVLQFTTNSSSENITASAPAGRTAHHLVLGVYYAQRDFWKQHQRWATNLAELETVGWKLPEPSPDTKAPLLESSPDGYTCASTFTENGQTHVWRVRQDRLLKLDQRLPLESDKFVAEAAAQFGDAGRRAAYFLLDNMPPADRATLSCEFLIEDVRYALEARNRFPWAKTVPERLFLNDVLPYASLDEPRDLWRAQFFNLAGELVRDCKSASDAAQALNRDLFKRINVHYNLGRKRNNQGPLESIEEGKATCTGLAIILVDACRAVGVPARIAAVPEWSDKKGNHTWVEIWDGDWFFTGADEYDAKGLNRAWFNNDAARTARSDNPLNQVYATSWRRTGQYFPMAWALASREVNGVNVSGRYAALPLSTNSTTTIVHVRLRQKREGERLVAEVEMRDPNDQLIAHDKTRGWTADLNDMPDFTLPAGAAQVTFRFIAGAEAREQTVPCASCANSHTLDFSWDQLAPTPASVLETEAWLAKPSGERSRPPEVAISSKDVPRLSALLWGDLLKTQAGSAANELSGKQIVIEGKSLKWMEKNFGDAPNGKHSLWITLHGGGQGTEEENDRNWKGYYGRYEFPPGSINVAPRAPANTWDMWHVPWVDGLLDRLIADMVLARGVDPNRVYLIGYSAGGDGVYQLAPRMADRFAAATMCAGHPNAVTPEGLRNLPFFLYMGGEDSAYHRNTVVREFSAKIDALQAADPEGYSHRLTVYPGLQHNMQNREAEVIPRMSGLQRVTWPKRVVWKENDNFIHPRFYWLERVAGDTNAETVYAAHVEGQTITIETPASGKVTLRLSDQLVDLDQPVRVVAGGRTLFEGPVSRSLSVMAQSLRERADPELVATALLPVSW
ncbi:MAG TPA: sugar-binding protein [Verrucomicrobiae bacterium]|nr:sugar-binding protein [Verrucomicrobiae bacterium]